MTLSKVFPPRVAAVIFLAVLILAACSSEETPPAPGTEEQEGFTFFDVGSASRYSEALREQLSERLGPDAIETRSLINLEVVRDGFLQRHFPNLAELNARLNYPPGERVDHDTYKLMYRYAASRRNLPFDLVEIVFSGKSRKPLFISIRSRRDLSEVLESVEQKYGPPQQVETDSGARATYWRDGGDVFLAAFVPTRRGVEVRIMIYYADHLRQLAEREEEQRRQEKERRSREGKRAF